MAKPIALLLAAVILTFASYAQASEPITVSTIKIGPHKFAIPQKYLYESSPLDALKRWLGLDDGSRELLLIFYARDLAKNVPGFVAHDNKYTADIVARLIVLSADEQAAYFDTRRHRDLWYGQGQYKDRIIEQYPGRPWFKVFRKVEYPYSWAVLKQIPTSDEAMPSNVSDYWIADCLARKSPATASGEFIECKTQVVFKDLMVDFSVSESSLSVVDGVRQHLLSKVRSWQRS
jgi:hypothetical protein